MEVYDLSGRKVSSIEIGDVPAGSGSIGWNCRGEAGEDLATGVYLIRLLADNGIFDTRRVLIVR
jgi:flagellar hook assembly protein FlgD